MHTLEIKVPDSESLIEKEFLKEMGVSIKVKKENKIPNVDTISAMKELKAGKGIKSKVLKNFSEAYHQRFSYNLSEDS